MSFSTSKLDIFYAPLVAFLCLFVVPIFIVSSNASDLQHFNAPLTIGLLALLALIGAIAMTLVAIVLYQWKNGILLLPLRFVFFFLLAAGLFLPLTTTGGQAEIHTLPVDKFNVVAAAAAALFLFGLTLTPARNALLFGATMVLVFTGANSSYSAYQSIYIRAPSALYEASSTRNLFVVSFDGLPGMIGKEILEENAQLRQALRDFTLYENVAGNASSTFSSIVAEVSGIPDLKDRYDTMKAVYAAFRNPIEFVTDRLNDNGFSVSTYGAYGSTLKQKSRQFSQSSLVNLTSSRTRVLQIGELLIYTTARLASSKFVPEGNPLTRVAGRLGRQLEGQDQKLVRQLEQHANAQWDAANIPDILALRNYQENLQIKTDQPVAHFLHFLHTHFPIDFDSACEYRSDDAAWIEANMNRQGLKNQTQCALSQFSNFVSHLKEAGIYDNALVIFKSDHGEPVYYHDPNRLESFKIRNHTQWGFGRHSPFLAVKLPEQSADDLTIDPRPVALGDLAHSICTSLVAETGNCDSFQGYNIFDPQTVIPDEAIYSLEVVKDEASNFIMDTSELIRVPRAPGIFTALNNYLTDELLHDAPGCDIGFNLTEGMPYNNGLTDKQHWVSWRDGHITSVKTLKPSCMPTQITIEVDDDSLIDTVSVNGVIAQTEAKAKNSLTVLVPALPASDDTQTVVISVSSSDQDEVAKITSLSYRE